MARAPKISTGSASGSVSSDSSAPLRRMPSVSPAPIEPIRLRATVPTATEATMPGTAACRRAQRLAASGAIKRQRQPGEQPVRRGLCEQQPGERLARERVLLERAVLSVVAKQQLEREQRG